MGQMFDKTRDQMGNSKWDNPCAIRDQVNRCNQQTTNSVRVKRTDERFSSSGSDDLRAKIEPPSCRQYKPGHFMAVRPLNWDEIINEDIDDHNWANAGAPTSGRCCPGDSNDNHDGNGEENTQGGETGTEKGKGIQDGKGKWKATKNRKGKDVGNGKGNGKGNGIVQQTTGGDDISCAVAWQLQKEMSEPDLDTKGWLDRVYLQPEALPVMSLSSDDGTDSTELDSQYDSERESDVDMHMEDDVDALDGIDLDGDVDMEKDGEDKEDEEDKDETKDQEVDEDEKEDEDADEDNGKESRTIGHGEMGNTSADDADTMVDDQRTMLPKQGQEMSEHTPLQHHPAPAPRPQTPEPHPRPRTPETYTRNGLEILGLLMPLKPNPAAPTVWEAEAAGNTPDVDVEQQLLGKSAGGDSVRDVLLPNIPVEDVALPHVPLPDFPHSDVPLTEAHPDGSVGEGWTSPCVAEEACVLVRLGFLSCEFPLV